MLLNTSTLRDTGTSTYTWKPEDNEQKKIPYAEKIRKVLNTNYGIVYGSESNKYEGNDNTNYWLHYDENKTN